MSVWDNLVGQDDAIAVLRPRRNPRTRSPRTVRLARGGGGDDARLAVHRAGRFRAFGGGAGVRRRAAVPTCSRPRMRRVRAPAGRSLARAHPDVRSVVPDGLSIGVEEMRAVVALAARRPSLGRWQVVVIEDADRLTEQAANALLKAVEEPPPRTVFLLCAPSTHPDDVPLTIRSRCRLVCPAHTVRRGRNRGP